MADFEEMTSKLTQMRVAVGDFNDQQLKFFFKISSFKCIQIESRMLFFQVTKKKQEASDWLEIGIVLTLNFYSSGDIMSVPMHKDKILSF